MGKENTWWFMRDNHTFRELKGSPDDRIAAIMEEIADGYTSGAVFCRGLKVNLHCDYRNIAAFTEECRKVFKKEEANV